ncbi:MAG: hypothetical protein WA117_19290, partial [Verrucomicrobiia bacterium]
MARKVVIFRLFRAASNVPGAQPGLSHVSVGLRPACAGMDKTYTISQHQPWVLTDFLSDSKNESGHMRPDYW